MHLKLLRLALVLLLLQSPGGRRITLFCALPMASLDRLSLQRRLDDIGKSKAPDESAA